MLSGTHDTALVLISLLIAVLASYASLDLAGRIAGPDSRVRTIWTAAAAVVMGGGIWAMHFVAMLAYRMPGMSAGYDVWLTAISLVAAVGSTFAGFWTLSRGGVSPSRLLGAGSLMGLGVVAMHYIGMSAMKMPAHIRYAPGWVAISVLIALVAATAALWLSFRRSGQVEKVGAALVMGAAISGMHYSAMQGVAFMPMVGMDASSAPSGMGQTALAFGVASASFMILVISLAASVFDRRIADYANREAEAWRLSHERFQALYRGTPLPLHSLDADGRIEQVSNTWLDLTGYSREDVVGRWIGDFMTPESAGAMKDELTFLREHGTIVDREHRFVTKSGVVRDVLLSARVDRDASGGFVSILGGMTDVTERHVAEQALRQAQKLEAIGQLTGGVAHDFNNLLAVVVGNLDLARRRVADDPKTLRLVESALEGATRGASLTQRLLAFARRQDLRPAAVDVAALVDGMSELLRRSLGPMVRIETDFPGGLPPAQVDAHQLEMAILNLAVNARDAMPSGGVLVIGAGVAWDAASERSLLRIDVTDNGIGMDAATLAKASEPFFTTKGVGKGTGLGLSMVQGLAAQSGGRLVLRSRPGEGTTIELWLPLAAAPEATVDGPRAFEASRPPERFRAASILVVDDDPLVLDNTVAMLEDLGHQVVRASSAREALAVLPVVRDIDLVVTDQIMPGMTGVQLAREIASRRPNLPILLASGYSDMCFESGSSLPLLSKPFDQAALDKAVRSALSGSNVVDIDPARRISRGSAA